MHTTQKALWCVACSTVLTSSKCEAFLPLITINYSKTTKIRYCLSTFRLRIGSLYQDLLPGRAFPVAASLLWNSLPSDVQASSPLFAFRQHLKTFIFCQSFPDIFHWSHYAFVVYARVFAILATLKKLWLTLTLYVVSLNNCSDFALGGYENEPTCGRPLGMRLDSDGYLIVCDAELGIFKINVATGMCICDLNIMFQIFTTTLF